MAFYNKNGDNTNFYRSHPGWYSGTLGNAGADQSLTQVSTNLIGGFYLNLTSEVINAGTTSFGLRLFQNGSAITSYGSAYDATGSVVSGKSTSYIDCHRNTNSNAAFDVVTSTVKVTMNKINSSFTHNWAFVEVKTFNDNIGWEHYFYKVPVSDSNGFDYTIHWDWLLNGGGNTLTHDTYDLWYSPFTTHSPPNF